jgi:hypothetical protein
MLIINLRTSCPFHYLLYSLSELVAVQLIALSLYW